MKSVECPMTVASRLMEDLYICSNKKHLNLCDKILLFSQM